MRIILIAGEPATGKTTLMKEIIKECGPSVRFKQGLVEGQHHFRRNLIVLGKYDGGTFDGTDRLSMAVVPALVKWLEAQDGANDILMEGDRVTSRSLIDQIKGRYSFAGFCLLADKEMIDQRHQARGDAQSEVFLRGRKTKIKNLLEYGCLTPVKHETPTHTGQLCKTILDLLKPLPDKGSETLPEKS